MYIIVGEELPPIKCCGLMWLCGYFEDEIGLAVIIIRAMKHVI